MVIEEPRRLESALAMLASAAAADFVLQIGSATAAAASLRELAELAEQHQARADSAPDPAAAVPAGLGEVFTAVLAEAEAAQGAAVEGLDLAGLDEQKLAADPLAEILAALNPRDAVAAAVGQLTALVEGAEDPDDAATALAALLRASVPRPARSPAFPAVLGAICSCVESVLVRALRRLEFERAGAHASILGPDLDDAVQGKIGSGGALAKWTEELRVYGVDLGTLMIDWDELVELFARRNLFVHRGGRVDQRYRAKVAGAPPLGSVLELTADYLRDGVDRAEALMVAIPLALLAGRGTTEAVLAAGCAASCGHLAQREGEVLLAEAYAHLAVAFEPDGTEREAHRVNEWLARSQRLGLGSVAAQVEAWDVDELPGLFRLARHVLLGQDAEGLALLGRLRAAGEVTDRQVRSWPLFRRWREEAVL